MVLDSGLVGKVVGLVEKAVELVETEVELVEMVECQPDYPVRVFE